MTIRNRPDDLTVSLFVLHRPLSAEFDLSAFHLAEESPHCEAHEAVRGRGVNLPLASVKLNVMLVKQPFECEKGQHVPAQSLQGVQHYHVNTALLHADQEVNESFPCLVHASGNAGVLDLSHEVDATIITVLPDALGLVFEGDSVSRLVVGGSPAIGDSVHLA